MCNDEIQHNVVLTFTHHTCNIVSRVNNEEENIELVYSYYIKNKGVKSF